MIKELYTSGDYLKKNPSWHIGESPWKVKEIMDVLEHIENPYDLLRDIKSKSPYKIIQFPLDISVRSVLTDQIVKYREMYGHIHYFTKSIAFRMLEEMGYEVLDCFYTSEFIPLPWNEIKSNPLLFVRKILGKIKREILGASGKLLLLINQDLAERLFGEWRLLVLAR